MPLDPNFTLLYVADPMASAAFYESLLGKPPVECSPGFAMFALGTGGMLGLWKRDDVQPAADGAPGAAELAFAVQGGRAEVDGVQADWQRRGVAIVQAATAMDFGYTFTALDPDRHRLRVFAPEGGA